MDTWHLQILLMYGRIPLDLLPNRPGIFLLILQKQLKHLLIGRRVHIGWLMHKAIESAEDLPHRAARLPIIRIDDRHTYATAFVNVNLGDTRKYVLEVFVEGDDGWLFRVLFWEGDGEGE
jgi:hypothetical protein